MGAIRSEITSPMIVFSAVYLDTHPRKYWSSASLAFVRGIHRRPVNSPHKWPVTRKKKCFHLMTSSWNILYWMSSTHYCVTRERLRTCVPKIGIISGATTHDDVIKWKNFPRYWPFVRGIHRSPVNSPHKGQWRGALMFSLICDWINGWVNNREAGDLRRHRGNYDVIVMQVITSHNMCRV